MPSFMRPTAASAAKANTYSKSAKVLSRAAPVRAPDPTGVSSIHRRNGKTAAKSVARSTSTSVREPPKFSKPTGIPVFVALSAAAAPRRHSPLGRPAPPAARPLKPILKATKDNMLHGTDPPAKKQVSFQMEVNVRTVPRYIKAFPYQHRSVWVGYESDYRFAPVWDIVASDVGDLAPPGVSEDDLVEDEEESSLLLPTFSEYLNETF